MKRPRLLRNLLLLAGFLVLLSGCGGSLAGQGETPSVTFPVATQGETPPPTVPVASPPAGAVQLKPEGAIPSSCSATPVYKGGAEKISGTGGLPWIQAQPSSSSIRGYLFYGQTSPTQRAGTYRFLHTGGGWNDGTNTKILWSIDNSQSRSPFQVNGTNLSDPGKAFHQTFPGAIEVPSIVVVPSAGCWRLQLISGQMKGTIVMWVVG